MLEEMNTPTHPDPDMCYMSVPKKGPCPYKVIAELEAKLKYAESQPWLGLATTGELLDEIRARVNCNYKTVGYECPAFPSTATPK